VSRCHSTPPDAVFLTEQAHTHPIPAIAGRQVVCGFHGWIWTHGFQRDMARRPSEVQAMLNGQTPYELRKRLMIKYKGALLELHAVDVAAVAAVDVVVVAAVDVVLHLRPVLACVCIYVGCFFLCVLRRILPPVRGSIPSASTLKKKKKRTSVCSLSSQPPVLLAELVLRLTSYKTRPMFSFIFLFAFFPPRLAVDYAILGQDERRSGATAQGYKAMGFTKVGAVELWELWRAPDEWAKDHVHHQ
jgi:hypothetical protein